VDKDYCTHYYHVPGLLAGREAGELPRRRCDGRVHIRTQTLQNLHVADAAGFRYLKAHEHAANWRGWRNCQPLPDGRSTGRGKGLAV